jgi:predicted membrane GTPase involved in stress response
MVDGAVLLVDAVEGPLAQTKFVLAKALARGLAPVVVLNKVDRAAVSQARCDAVASSLFDLFAGLGADDAQLDFPVLYASAKQVRWRALLARARVRAVVVTCAVAQLTSKRAQSHAAAGAAVWHTTPHHRAGRA